MVGIKLNILKQEINKYIGVPYFINIPPQKLDKPERVLVGKGSAKEIALKTIELANQQNINLANLNSQQIYNFQKKNKIGIDCSGLACHLLNFLLNQGILPVTQTSASALTSEPLSTKININDAKTGDLIRQENGHHVLFIVEKIGNIIRFVESSQSGRGVSYGNYDIDTNNPKIDEIFRLKQLS